MIADTLNTLSKTLTEFSAEAQAKKIQLLDEMRGHQKFSAKDIINYNDKLLFHCAYADDQNILKLANSELSRVSDMIQNNGALKEKLTNTGIVHTPTQSTYTFALCNWLIKTFPGTVSLHSFEEGAAHPKNILKFFLPQEEFEILFDDKLKPTAWLAKACGTINKIEQLEWLIALFEKSSMNDSLKEHLFESLKLYIEINPSDKKFSRTFGRIKVESHFFHNEALLKKFDEAELIRRALPKESKLGKEQKKEIIAQARIALCLLQRETDPVTYSEELNIKYFNLERGLSIAFFSMDKEQRLPLESYIGFMMFKNGYPMSYGGAWLFGKRALIGINIFEVFRGGESAVVFAQLLRCYHKAFGADYFEVEPYQFGKDNPEGIRSGAFWFYYRFGFRPLNEQLRALAAEEQEKIRSNKSYRSSFETLRKFTAGNLYLNLVNEERPVNPSDLSRFISNKINSDFKGNRSDAIKSSNQILKREGLLNAATKAGVSRLGMFVSFCLNLKAMNAKDKELLRKILAAKEQDEFEYIDLLNKFRFQKFLQNI